MVKNPPKIEIPAPRRLGVGSWWANDFELERGTGLRDGLRGELLPYLNGIVFSPIAHRGVWATLREQFTEMGYR